MTSVRRRYSEERKDDSSLEIPHSISADLSRPGKKRRGNGKDKNDKKAA